MSKRSLDSYFKPVSKRPKQGEEGEVQGSSTDPTADKGAEGTSPALTDENSHSRHPSYPFPIPNIPPSLSREISSWPASLAREMRDQPDLDLLYFEPYIPRYLARELFDFLRSQLPFYRVEYKIRRGGIETQVRTPR